MKKKGWKKVWIIIGVLLLLILSFVIYFNVAFNYVSIDINPSVMLGINSFDKVVKVKPLNTDADNLLKDLNLYGKDVNNAINEVISSANKLGYVNDNEENAVLISTYCNNDRKNSQLKQKINDNLNQGLNTNGIGSLIVDMELTKDDALKANEYGVSEAKILFVKKALEEHPELKFDDLVYLPAREIAKYIEGYDDLKNNNAGNSNNGMNNGNKNQYGKNNN